VPAPASAHHGEGEQILGFDLIVATPEAATTGWGRGQPESDADDHRCRL